MKDGNNITFGNSVKTNNINNSCLCESKNESKFVLLVDDTQSSYTVMTGLPYQEVNIDLSECKSITNKSIIQDNCKK
jgi:hypothetical protein